MTARATPAYPLDSPIGFLLHTAEVVHSTEQFLLLLNVLDVGINHQTVHFTMDVLDRNLESVKSSSLHNTHF